LITSLLHNAGLLIFMNFGSFFEKLTEELNTSDVYYLIPDFIYSDEIENFIDGHENTLETQKVKSVLISAEIPYNGSGSRSCTFLLNNADNQRRISEWKLIGDYLPLDHMSVYVPYVMSIDGGYRLNDKFEVNFDDKVITFTIKGFTEDAFFSSLDTGVMGVYMPHGTYERVREILGDKYDATLIYANLENQNKDVENGIRGLIRQDNPNINADATGTLLSLDLETVKLARNLMASGVSVMMIAFAVIIAVVCLVVVRF
jgi:putative ABC transport system permease protein